MSREDRTSSATGAYVVIGNIYLPDSALRMGARVRILAVPGDPAKAFVRGISRGGRVIDKWIASSRLRRLRVAWEPKPKKRQEWVTYETREEAARGTQEEGEADRG